MKDELLGEERQRRKTLKRSYHNLKAKLKVLRLLMILYYLLALFFRFCRRILPDFVLSLKNFDLGRDDT